VLFRARPGAAHQLRLRPPDHQAARLQQQGGSRLALQLAPQLVGALDHGHVNRILEIRFADDAALSVRRTHRVRWREAVESAYAHAAAAKVVRRRTAHGTETSDQYVVVTFHRPVRVESRGCLEADPLRGSE